MEPTYTRIVVDRPEPGIERITLARAETRNAQDKRMIYEINDAYDEAMADEAVSVVVLRADGPEFSSGHDVRDREALADFDNVTEWRDYGRPGAEGYFGYERELYLQMAWRWRNLPKPVISQVHGKVIAGGLVLIWPTDIIVASDDATFSDPVVAFAVNAHEYFVHPWEVGHRMAREMLYTGRSVSASLAQRLGMVNHVVPREELDGFTLDLARRIASQPLMGLKMAKLSVNAALDAQGQWNALQTAFALHQLAHTHNKLEHGVLVDPAGLQKIRDLSAEAPIG